MAEPNKWVLTKFADFGASEQFVSEFLELFDLLGSTHIPEQQKKLANDAIGTILVDGLSPTFLELQAIRASVGKELPRVNRNQIFEDFARKLWKSYRDLTKRSLLAMGVDMGFVWNRESVFEAGLVKFRRDYPAALPNFEQHLRNIRKNWQNDLCAFRNEFLEHQEGSRADFAKFYNERYCESLFYAVWRTIVELHVCVMNLKLPRGIYIVEHSDALHGPGWPKRFRWVRTGFKVVGK